MALIFSNLNLPRQFFTPVFRLKSFRPAGHSLVQVIKEKGQTVAVV